MLFKSMLFGLQLLFPAQINYLFLWWKSVKCKKKKMFQISLSMFFCICFLYFGIILFCATSVITTALNFDNVQSKYIINLFGADWSVQNENLQFNWEAKHLKWFCIWRMKTQVEYRLHFNLKKEICTRGDAWPWHIIHCYIDQRRVPN